MRRKQLNVNFHRFLLEGSSHLQLLSNRTDQRKTYQNHQLSLMQVHNTVHKKCL